MSRMQVSASERGLVRLFAVDLPAERIAEMKAETKDDALPAPLLEALGTDRLDPGYVEFFDVGDLEELGLRGYMTEGLGIAEKDVTEDGLRIDTIRGHVLIVLSAAFGGTEQTLAPRAPLRWVGTYAEEQAQVRFKPLRTSGAQGRITGGKARGKPANPHLTLLVALLALPVMALIIGAIVWGVLR